jgi:hypothetical protein
VPSIVIIIVLVSLIIWWKRRSPVVTEQITMTENLTEEWINHSSASHFNIRNIFVDLSKPMLHFLSAFFSLFIANLLSAFFIFCGGNILNFLTVRMAIIYETFPFMFQYPPPKSSEIMRQTLDSFISGKVFIILLDRVNQFI